MMKSAQPVGANEGTTAMAGLQPGEHRQHQWLRDDKKI